MFGNHSYLKEEQNKPTSSHRILWNFLEGRGGNAFVRKFDSALCKTSLIYKEILTKNPKLNHVTHVKHATQQYLWLPAPIIYTALRE